MGLNIGTPFIANAMAPLKKLSFADIGSRAGTGFKGILHELSPL